jgi:hypothetical protein
MPQEFGASPIKQPGDQGLMLRKRETSIEPMNVLCDVDPVAGIEVS